MSAETEVAPALEPEMEPSLPDQSTAAEEPPPGEEPQPADPDVQKLPDLDDGLTEHAAEPAASVADGGADDSTNNKRKPEDDCGADEPAAKRATSEANPGAGGEITETIEIANEKVGKLIGRQGITIKDVTARGGARIKIEQSTNGNMKPVSITGSAEAVAHTKQLIEEALAAEASAAGGETHKQVSCPAHIVGRIIGRGGETIRGLQTASSARIVINQDFPEGEPRIVEISGQTDCVQRAYDMVMELINTDGTASTHAVIQKFGQVVTRVLDCPKHMVGRIIGRSGETIKGLQKQFAATIQIDQHSMPCKITISGPAVTVSAVERAVMELMDNRPGGGPGGFGGGMPFPGPGFMPPFGGPFPGPAFPGYGAPPFPGYGPPAPYGYPGYGMPPPNPYGAPYYGAGPDPYAAAAAAAAAYGAHGYGGAAASGSYAGAQQASTTQQQAQQQAAQAPQQQQAAAASGSVWQALQDDQNRTYYYNSQTGISQWDRPADMP